MSFIVARFRKCSYYRIYSQICLYFLYIWLSISATVKPPLEDDVCRVDRARGRGVFWRDVGGPVNSAVSVHQRQEFDGFCKRSVALFAAVRLDIATEKTVFGAAPDAANIEHRHAHAGRTRWTHNMQKTEDNAALGDTHYWSCSLPAQRERSSGAPCQIQISLWSNRDMFVTGRFWSTLVSMVTLHFPVLDKEGGLTFTLLANLPLTQNQLNLLIIMTEC